MRDTTAELKELRLHGMASAWTDLLAQGESAVCTSKWLIEHLLRAEHTDRAMRSVSHQMNAAKFPIHRDLAGFDFEASKVDQTLVSQLATLAFTDTAQNAVLIGGPGTGKTHLATAIAVAGIAAMGKRVRFYCWTVFQARSGDYEHLHTTLRPMVASSTRPAYCVQRVLAASIATPLQHCGRVTSSRDGAARNSSC